MTILQSMNSVTRCVEEGKRYKNKSSIKRGTKITLHIFCAMLRFSTSINQSVSVSIYVVHGLNDAVLFYYYFSFFSPTSTKPRA